MSQDEAGGGGRRADVACALGLLLLHAAIAFLHSGALDPRLFGFEAMNVWFEGDPPRIYANMTDRWSSHHRQFVHPMFSLVACTPPYVLTRLLDLEPLLVLRALAALVAGLFAGTFYATLRVAGSQRPDSVLFTLLVMASASALFWFPLPESYPYGALSIVAALGFVAWGERRRLPLWGDFAVNALTFWFTLTNWMVGVLANLSLRGWRWTAGLSLGTLALTALLWLGQKEIYPDSYFFGRAVNEVQYALPEGTGGPLRVTESFFLHSMVMPEITVFQKFEDAPYPVMSTQRTGAGSAGPLGRVGVALWGALLALGSLCLLRDPRRPLHAVLGLSILGQWLLHLLYGDETFLYSLHFAPMLVLLAALPLRTRLRPLVLALAAALVVCAALNNLPLLAEASRFFEGHGAGAAH